MHRTTPRGKKVFLLLALIGSTLFMMGPVYRVNTGLENLERQSEAVAVVRILPEPSPGDINDQMWTDGEGIVSAEVLGTFKGDIKAGTTTTILLRVLPAGSRRRDFPASAEPDASLRGPTPGVYLMFLDHGGAYGGWATIDAAGNVKKRTPRSGERVDWQAVNTGGNVLVLRNPQPPYTLKPGETVVQAVRRLLGTQGTQNNEAAGSQQRKGQ